MSNGNPIVAKKFRIIQNNHFFENSDSNSISVELYQFEEKDLEMIGKDKMSITLEHESEVVSPAYIYGICFSKYKLDADKLHCYAIAKLESFRDDFGSIIPSNIHSKVLIDSDYNDSIALTIPAGYIQSKPYSIIFSLKIFNGREYQYRNEPNQRLVWNSDGAKNVNVIGQITIPIFNSEIAPTVAYVNELNLLGEIVTKESWHFIDDFIQLNKDYYYIKEFELFGSSLFCNGYDIRINEMYNLHTKEKTDTIIIEPSGAAHLILMNRFTDNLEIAFTPDLFVLRSRVVAMGASLQIRKIGRNLHFDILNNSKVHIKLDSEFLNKRYLVFHPPHVIQTYIRDNVLRILNKSTTEKIESAKDAINAVLDISSEINIELLTFFKSVFGLDTIIKTLKRRNKFTRKDCKY